jgi:serine/threonine-protein kinase
VYLAVATGIPGFAKLVVLKEPHKDFLERPEGREMFLDEARIAARFSHPNVVQTLEVIDSDPPCIVMEYLEGCTLAALAKKAGSALTLEMVCRILSDTLLGLYHVHVQADFDGTPLGLVHRDANPQNIFVTFDGQAKLLDFGIAKIANVEHTEQGVVKGKIRYMPPEQFVGAEIDRRADIFAVGVVLWEAATRTRMWSGMADYAVMQALVHGEIASARSVRASVPEEIDRICTKALAVDRTQRYESAEDMARDLDAFLDVTNQHVTSREVARLVSSTFVEQRNLTRKLIDRQLSQDGPTTIPGLATLSRSDAGLRTTTTTGVGFAKEAAKKTTAPPPAPSLSPRPGLSVRAKVVVWLSAITLVGVISMLVVGRSTEAKRTQSPPVADDIPSAATKQVGRIAPEEAPAAPSAPSPAENRVRIAISATPAQARIYVDGKPLPTNPYSDALAADGKHHSVAAAAPGYATTQTDVVFDRDQQIALALTRAIAPARPVTPAAPQASHPPKAPEPGFVNEL